MHTIVKPQGLSSSHIFSSCANSSLLSFGSRMNSKRFRPEPPKTHVVGRLGSQICAVPTFLAKGGT